MGVHIKVLFFKFSVSINFSSLSLVIILVALIIM